MLTGAFERARAANRLAFIPYVMAGDPDLETTEAILSALSAAGATAALVAANVANCQFTLTAGTAARNALATLSLQISQNGQSVQLLNEVQVVNTP